jgi:hypothetical protein
MGDDLERAFEQFDASALNLVEQLIQIPATPDWPANIAMALLTIVAESREKVATFRQYRRDLFAEEAARKRRLGNAK